MNYPKNHDQLETWLINEMLEAQPSWPNEVIAQMVSKMMTMVPDDEYSIRTVCEGWLAQKNDSVDPERAKRSLKEMKDNGLI